MPGISHFPPFTLSLSLSLSRPLPLSPSLSRSLSLSLSLTLPLSRSPSLSLSPSLPLPLSLSLARLRARNLLTRRRLENPRHLPLSAFHPPAKHHIRQPYMRDRPLSVLAPPSLVSGLGLRVEG